MKPTAEQQEIIEADAGTLVINAFAGSGKTTTLEAYARARPGVRFTYLAFNRATKEDAARRFPSNVKCITSHALAYRDFGRHYEGKIGNAKPLTIAAACNTSYPIAKTALDTVTNFLCSPDDKLDLDKHLPVRSRTEDAIVFEYANAIWKRMQDTSDRKVFIPHDGYLKLYQLSKPTIDTDIILGDEWQDTNPAVTNIVDRQTARKVFVGDENQAIYGFRGAVNALANVEADKRLYLSSSFRFGPGIASLATLLLRDWKGELREIKGMGKHATIFSVSDNEPRALLARTNSGLFDAAVKVMLSNQPFGYVGDVKNYRLDMVHDAWRLKRHRKAEITDPSVRPFQSYADMERYADETDDKELKMLIKVVKEYGDDIPILIGRIKAGAKPALDGNEVVLTTAHKSKGLEFPSVVLLDDFAPLKECPQNGGWLEGPKDEDINLLYVAATRAEKKIRLNSAIEDWLNALRMYDTVTEGCSVSGFVGRMQREEIQKQQRSTGKAVFDKVSYVSKPSPVQAVLI